MESLYFNFNYNGLLNLNWKATSIVQLIIFYSEVSCNFYRLAILKAFDNIDQQQNWISPFSIL